MSCPHEIAEIILEILSLGLLEVRYLAWTEDATRCGAEADHIHNLPALLLRYSPELLVHYWEVERVSYMSLVSADRLAVWEPLWRRLQTHVETLAPSNSVK
jgi:hypothetical protein